MATIKKLFLTGEMVWKVPTIGTPENLNGCVSPEPAKIEFEKFSDADNVLFSADGMTYSIGKEDLEKILFFLKD